MLRTTAAQDMRGEDGMTTVLKAAGAYAVTVGAGGAARDAAAWLGGSSIASGASAGS
jgi:hypothetical protein